MPVERSQNTPTVDHAGRHVEHMRAAHDRAPLCRGARSRSRPARGGEELLVIGEAKLAAGRPHAAVEDQPVGPHSSLERRRGPSASTSASTCPLGVSHITAVSACACRQTWLKHVEVIGLLAGRDAIRLKIDDGQEAFRVMLEGLLTAHSRSCER